MPARGLWFLSVALLLIAGPAVADLAVGSLFTEGAVLQRDRPVRVWGTAEPGERVNVALGSKHGRAVADEEGRWVVTLAAQKAVRSPRVLKVRGSRGGRIEVRDVMLGDVWVCSGQSNMAMAVAGVRDAAAEIAAADLPGIRLMTVPRKISGAPLEQFAGRWVKCSPATVRSFSAVGYFFGREIHREIGVPIGLIHTSWGGTPAEAWASAEALAGEPKLAGLLARWTAKLDAYDPEGAAKRHEAALAKWEQAAKAAADAGGKAPRRPRALADPRASTHRPSGLFNGMVSPLLPFAVRGVIWYQGESNAARADQYRTLFPLMIRDWRRAFGEEELPFYFVQLANYLKVKEEPGNSAWAELRDAQFETLRALPHTGMALAIDIGEAADIHPKNKQEVGRRLALWALADAYGEEEVVPSGPLYREYEVRDGEIVISFDHALGGLAPLGELKGFAIAGVDQKFVWGNARIEGDTVIVSHPDVPEPMAVRYAWADNPPTSLGNAAGLPASPFRTDDWLGTTAGKD